MAYKFRAPAAMRIARMDRQKFNEAVADGFYVCAPSAVRGTARVFDEDDLIALFYFGRLTQMNIPSRLAGHLACQVREWLSRVPEEVRGTPAEPRISNLRSISGMGTTFSGYDPDHHAKGLAYPGCGDIALSIEFNVAQVRAFIRSEIAAELEVLGEDEEG